MNICNNYTNCNRDNMPIFNKKNWNKIYNKGFYKHNCYAYALDQFQDLSLTDNKPQMGYYGSPDAITGRNLKSCSDLKHRVLIDNPHIHKIKYDKECKKGYYKVNLFISPNQDYHWYRQDKNGKYSHKPGLTEITNRNNSNKLITNPYLANRIRINSNSITDYSIACDTFCVPNKNTFVE